MNMTKEFNETQKRIKDWLNRVVADRLELLHLGCADDNHLDIEICGLSYDVHIYKGLERIAFYLGRTVTYDPTWSEDKGRMYFMYEGLEVFQLWNKSKQEL